jgi:hypothetical protein
MVDDLFTPLVLSYWLTPFHVRHNTRISAILHRCHKISELIIIFGDTSIETSKRLPSLSKISELVLIIIVVGGILQTSSILAIF